ncbi:MAG TPA: hypothetical protein VFM99_00705 [Chitinophagales bacterium]|nr:hypothetical protein [Chitinophagales bacterium]
MDLPAAISNLFLIANQDETIKGEKLDLQQKSGQKVKLHFLVA